MEPSTPQSTSVAIPIAIVFGFGLIALAIYLSGIGQGPIIKPDTQNQVQHSNGKIKPVDSSDYILGNPNAPIMIVEYSDYDCPFCKEFHTTMTQIMNEYGITGKVAWVYRQLPLVELHPNSARISEAALCVGEIAGNDAFWKFSNFIFNERGINELTNISRLPEYARLSGAEMSAFDSCVKSGRHQKTVEDSLRDGFSAGIEGTPHSFVLIGNQQAPVEGAQPYPVMKGIVENLLGQLEGREAPTTTDEIVP